MDEFIIDGNQKYCNNTLEECINIMMLIIIIVNIIIFQMIMNKIMRKQAYSVQSNYLSFLSLLFFLIKIIIIDNNYDYKFNS